MKNRFMNMAHSARGAVLTIFAASMLFTGQVFADQAQDIEKVRAEVTKMFRQAATAEIIPSPMKDVYQVHLQGTYAYAYVSGDFVLLGDLFNTKELVNVGDQVSSQKMASRIAKVPLDQMIVYGPKDAKRHITVFTDIDCGYCRKLHNEMPELTAAGIQVRYLAFPRAGVGSDSHKKYVSVWCSDDQQTALTTAKAGGYVASASCDNPVSNTYNLGKEVGVRGTPTIVFDDGTVAPGYIPSDRLIAQLGLK